MSNTTQDSFLSLVISANKSDVFKEDLSCYESWNYKNKFKCL